VPGRAGHPPNPRAVSPPARQVAHTLVVYAVTRVVLGGTAGVIVARALGPAGRGEYALLLTVATVAVCVGQLSLDQAHVAIWPAARARPAVAANAVPIGLAGGAAAAAAAAAILLGPAADLLPLSGGAPLSVALLAVPGQVIVGHLNSVLTLRGRVERVNWAGLAGAVAQCAGCGLLAAAGLLTVGWAVAAWAASVAVTAAVALLAVRPRPADLDARTARRTLATGLRHHPGAVALFLLFRVDVLILGALAPASAVGGYALAVALMELTRMAADAIAQAALPRQADGEVGDAFAHTARVTRLAVAVSVASVALMCAAAPALVPLVYGPAFGAAVPVLFTLAPGLCALGASRAIAAVLPRIGRPLAVSAAPVAALALCAGLAPALIPGLGAVGCAVAACAGQLLLAALQVAWFLRASRISPAALLPGAAEAGLLLGALCRPRVRLARRAPG